MKTNNLFLLAFIYLVMSMGNNLYAQNFTENIITKSNRWIAPKYIDYDGDGDMDVIAVSSSGEIAWWENDSDLGFTKHELINTSYTFRHFDVADIDADGDLDIIALEIFFIRLYYNDGNDIFTEVYNGINNMSSNIIAGNFDSDSDLEFITSEGNNTGRIRIWNPQGNGTFDDTLIDNLRVLSTGSMLAEDLDSDGDLDIVASLRIVPSGSNSLFYYLNDGTGTFTKQSISYTNGNSLNQVIDYNNDGHKDIIIKNTFNCCVTVFENDGNLNFTEIELISGASALETSFMSDSDNDGDVDIITVHNDPFDSNPERYVGVYENDGSSNFSFQVIAPIQKGNFVTALDISNDGLPELLVGAEASNHPVVLENMGSHAYAPIELDDTFVPILFDIEDMNNDGLNEIISVSHTKNELLLWKNNGLYSFNKQIIELNELHINSAQIVDVDGDQIKDILVTTHQSGEQKIILYQNDGNYGFTKHLLRTSSNLLGAPELFVRDRDADTDPDILFNSSPSDGVLCLQNDGNNNYTEISISDEEFRLLTFQVSDVNSDGFDDLISELDVYYLNDGLGGYTTANFPVDGTIGDLDSDGDVDIVHVEISTNGQYISWFENNNGTFIEHIISDPYRGGNTLVRDFDGDGDIDIVSAPTNDFNSEGLVFWENDGSEMFIKNVIEDTYYIDSSILYHADLDGDGDIEVLSSNPKFPFTIWNNESNIPLNVNSFESLHSSLIYPTIVDENLTIKTQKNILDISVYDLQGKSIEVNQHSNKVHVSGLSQGIYILHITFESKETQIFKFIKN
ncbi:T9SS type A sorting domain-containing protein [Psychroserpens sp.]|uniref:T9SS type A sorting domain-containing protein n=1 Tax=Psychroserpens sp. TaxID=2020870 RepID=UPI002B27AE88|nr:T9SS type A sorting domain-containing protein [Psychroserpens sp.]